MEATELGKNKLRQIFIWKTDTEINSLNQSKIVRQLAGQRDVKSPESCIRFLLKLKCTVWVWSSEGISPGQSWFSISLCLCNRYTQEPETWAFGSKAGSAWEGRHHTLAPWSAPALPARVGVGRGALEVLLSPEILHTAITKESARQPPCPCDSGPGDEVSSVSPG